jgi:hypothetical protein
VTAKERKTLLWFLVVVLGALLVASPFIYSSRRMAAIEARTLKVGDSREKVIELLGKPDDDFPGTLLLIERPIYVRPLVYRKRFGLWKTRDGKFPYYQLVRFRMSRCQTGDVTIFLDEAGRVKAVRIPPDKIVVGVNFWSFPYK